MSWRISDRVRAAIAAEPAFLGRREVANKHGVSETVVRHVRAAAGVPRNPRGWPRVWGSANWARGRKRGWPCRPLGRAPLAWVGEVAT